MCYLNQSSEPTRRQFIRDGLSVSAAILGAVPTTLEWCKTAASVSPDMSNIDIARAAGRWIESAKVVTDTGVTWLADPADPESAGMTLYHGSPGVVLFLLSLRKIKSLVYLALSILAVIVGSIFLFDQPGWQPAVNPVLAVVVSVFVAGFTWIVAQKSLEADQMRPAHDLEALVGAVGEAKTSISDEGSVQVAGELWSAKSEQRIPEGNHVRIIGRDGFSLVVEKIDE